MHLYLFRKKSLIATGLLLMASSAAMAQDVISGKVTDGQGDPLVGVSVKVEGTNTGTLTDAEGNIRSM